MLSGFQAADRTLDERHERRIRLDRTDAGERPDLASDQQHGMAVAEQRLAIVDHGERQGLDGGSSPGLALQAQVMGQ
ncbi:hypothetical protein D3C75_1314170 [compost metagenome]